MRLPRTDTQLRRAGLALAVFGLALLLVGLLMADLWDQYRATRTFFRYVTGNHLPTAEGAKPIRYGFWLTSAGLFLWLAYDATLGRLFRWIRNGQASTNA